ncbi:uncharacterized protein TNCT_386531 [Trichonephila clavata]|uniref:Uncharacterized protein n=1 Tax=Trichonephila clavata TaxID=2740835 RepID=A0A8X6FQL6_TRICU|nr:uncharacterized protein TNCT_386531 [Trichonephila clavata]
MKLENHVPEPEFEIKITSSQKYQEKIVTVQGKIQRLLKRKLNSERRSEADNTENKETVIVKTTWYHCPGDQNPADKITRESSVKQLSQDNSWKFGPPWLSDFKSSWPMQENWSICCVSEQSCSMCCESDNYDNSESDIVQQNSAPLPNDRIEKSQPFEITGMDFAGPLYLKDGSKVYVSLFTCAVTRNVHLEI